MSDRARKGCIITTAVGADSTVGKCYMIGYVAFGSAAASTITILDGTAIKIVRSVGVTANDQLSFYPGIPFTNMVVDLTGTASYSIIYQPA